RRLVVFKPIEIDQGPFATDLRNAMAQARKTYFQELECQRLTFTAFKQSMWSLFGPLAVDRTQVVLRSPFLDNDLLEVVYRAPAELVRDSDLSLRLVSDGNPKLNGIPTDRGLVCPSTPLLTWADHFYQQFTFR